MKVFGRKAVIAVPYWPGSNGDRDAIRAITDYGMQAEPLYFHFGDERRLAENAQRLLEADGAFIPGGFPYEDRLGFGRVPASIKPFSDAMMKMVADGKPVIAICAGAQIAGVMRMAFAGTDYNARLLPNICDRHGRIVYDGFLDKVVHTRLASPPERNAFTRHYKPDEIMPQIIDHGGGRFWADKETLRYLIENGMILKQYCDKNGNAEDNFPTNPNGSMLNIESITNPRGNLKVGMCHDERKTNALREDRANLAFASMREYAEDGCPSLAANSEPHDIPIVFKSYAYLCPELDATRTYDILIQMLTDDNTRTTAQLFLGEGDIDRRRLLRIELANRNDDQAKEALKEIASMDLLDGIILKKDLPYLVTPEGKTFCYPVVERQGKTVVRDFVEKPAPVEGFPVTLEDVSSPNPEAYVLKKKLHRNPRLKELVTGVQTGAVFFFPDESSKTRAVEKLFY